MANLKIGAINAATPTPLKPDGSFDKASAKKLCRRWTDIGLDGVFVLGSMGEGPLLSDEVRNAWASGVSADKMDTFMSRVLATAEKAQEKKP